MPALYASSSTPGLPKRAETDLVVDAQLSLVEARQIAVDAEHRLLHILTQLATVTVHTDPRSPSAPTPMPI